MADPNAPRDHFKLGMNATRYFNQFDPGVIYEPTRPAGGFNYNYEPISPPPPEDKSTDSGKIPAGSHIQVIKKRRQDVNMGASTSSSGSNQQANTAAETNVQNEAPQNTLQQVHLPMVNPQGNQIQPEVIQQAPVPQVDHAQPEVIQQAPIPQVDHVQPEIMQQAPVPQVDHVQPEIIQQIQVPQVNHVQLEVIQQAPVPQVYHVQPEVIQQAPVPQVVNQVQHEFIRQAPVEPPCQLNLDATAMPQDLGGAPNQIQDLFQYFGNRNDVFSREGGSSIPAGLLDVAGEAVVVKKYKVCRNLGPIVTKWKVEFAPSTPQRPMNPIQANGNGLYVNINANEHIFMLGTDA